MKIFVFFTVSRILIQMRDLQYLISILKAYRFHQFKNDFAFFVSSSKVSEHFFYSDSILYQATCCEHFTCIDMTEDSEESEEETDSEEDNPLKKKFSATAKVALALGSTSSRSKSEEDDPLRLWLCKQF